MGIITMALIVNNFQSTNEVQTWVQFICALAMALGTAMGGWRIIKTGGGKIMKIRPVNGVAAVLIEADEHYVATFFLFHDSITPHMQTFLLHHYTVLDNF